MMADPEEVTMVDFAYVAGSILFFVVMLLYVRACAALGRRADVDVGRDA
jgi:hypothetical protein